MHDHIGRNCCDIDTCWTEFWQPIIDAPGADGVLDREQNFRQELHDFHGMIKEVPSVYAAVTDDMISKPNTAAFEVVKIFRERFISKDLIVSDLEDLLKIPNIHLDDIRAYVAELKEELD